MIMSYFVFVKDTKISSEVRWAYIYRSRCGMSPVSSLGTQSPWWACATAGDSLQARTVPLYLEMSIVVAIVSYYYF